MKIVYAMHLTVQKRVETLFYKITLTSLRLLLASKVLFEPNASVLYITFVFAAQHGQILLMLVSLSTTHAVLSHTQHSFSTNKGQ